MEYKACSIIIPVLRETDLFEKVILRILDCVDSRDVEEFIIAIHPKYTTAESLKVIEKMRSECQTRGISYRIHEQILPGMGGAIRDAMEIARGTHCIMICADYCYDPGQIQEFIALAKEYPNDIISGSRFLRESGWSLSKGYPRYKLIWNKMSQLLLRVVYHGGITDYTAAYRMAPTRYFAAVKWEETAHPLSLEQTLKFVRMGARFHEIPFDLTGGSESGFWETFSYIRPAIKCRFTRKKDFLQERGNEAFV